MTAPSSAPSTPRIVGLLFGLAFLYGVWLLEPRWITGAVGLLVLYALLTHVDRVSQLANDVDGALRGLIAPSSSNLPTPPNAHIGGK